jgi:hypothetical protein
MTIQLNPNQQAVLAHAVQHANGKITWFPDHIKGGARQKVLAGLFNRALVTTDGTDHFVAAEGYDVLGLPRPTAAKLPEVAPLVAEPEMEAAAATVEAQWAQETERQIAQPLAVIASDAFVEAPAETAAVHRTRNNSKQASIIAMLKRDEGATIDQIVETTGWQRHTVRGTFAGAFKKKLGLTITSDKTDGQKRVYRIAA